MPIIIEHHRGCLEKGNFNRTITLSHNVFIFLIAADVRNGDINDTHNCEYFRNEIEKKKPPAKT